MGALATTRDYSFSRVVASVSQQQVPSIYYLATLGGWHDRGEGANLSATLAARRVTALGWTAAARCACGLQRVRSAARVPADPRPVHLVAGGLAVRMPWTELHDACQRGDAAKVRALLAGKADVNAQTTVRRGAHSAPPAGAQRLRRAARSSAGRRCTWPPTKATWRPLVCF